MATFVLVHGAYHGAWCWTKLLPEMKARGHETIALDMPGNGDDRTPLSQVTFADYGNRIVDTLAGLKEPAMLVGHSLGCQSIALAAEMRPDLVRRLVFLAGCIPVDGMSVFTLLELLKGVPSPPAAPPPGHMWHGAIGQQPLLDKVKELYYNDCSDEDIALAKSRLCEQSNAPRVTPIRLTAERFGKVDRAFIGCTLDNAATPAMQKATLAMVPCRTVINLPTSHSPFFSNPKLLADALHGLV